MKPVLAYVLAPEQRKLVVAEHLLYLKCATIFGDPESASIRLTLRDKQVIDF